MKRLENLNDLEAAIGAALRGALAQTWTAMPAIIGDFDPVAMTCTAQPAIRARITTPEGREQNATLPLLVDCPVYFPSGGNCTLTFPVKPGDECLVVFASRCIDAWWQSGKVQNQAEVRMHDLSDGFVYVGVRSQPRVLPAVSTRATPVSYTHLDVYKRQGIACTPDAARECIHVVALPADDWFKRPGAEALKKHRRSIE